LVIDKVFHLIYDEDNILNITLEIYEYIKNYLTIIIMNKYGSKNIITDTRDIIELNETIDLIFNQTKEFDRSLDDIIASTLK